jgi:hypothetical protein
LSDLKIIVLFSDENIRTFGKIYTDFRQRTLNLYGNIDGKKLTDLYPIFMFGILRSETYYLKYIYFHNSDQCWFERINYNFNKYEIMDQKMTDKNLKLDFTQGKNYNITQVNNWFNNITNPSESDTNLKNDIFTMYVRIF